MKTGLFLQAILFSVLYLSCSCKGPEPQPVSKMLTVAPDSLLFSANGGIDTIHLSTDASELRIEASENWVSISVGFGVARQKDIIVTVTASDVSHLRSAKLTISAPDADTVYVFIKQDAMPASLYPDYSQPIAPDASGMSRTATQIAREMYMGWNLGNTLEVPGNETGWGNPKATQLLIDSVKAAGFNTVRLPCAWDSYLENRTTAKINASWLARVKEVVDYCVKNNMYVILNIHWDGGWLENNVTIAKQAENNAKQKAIWQQIAMQFRDYDDHLLFAGTNEPNVENETQMTVLYSYLETFIDAVRQTGGRNAYRTLVVQGPGTDMTKTNQLMNRMPNDEVPNRLMAEVHYYTPWNFCGMDKDESWGKMFYYWGGGNHSSTDATRNATWGEEAELKRLFGLMKIRFTDKGIPIILGEFGALRRNQLTGDNLTRHLASRAYFYECVAREGRNSGMIPCLWDTGIHANNNMGIFVRSSGAIGDRQAYNALMKGAAEAAFPF
ncbi:MAG: cellulase family glycosylhydrolase [Paludibacter sp.]|nr:cellulase family glycosylhydrolase [Paludibacter sp.]